MKRINKYETAEHFNLTGTRVDALVQIHKWAADEGYVLVAVVPTEGGHKLRDYTVRVMDQKQGVYGIALEVLCGVKETERVNILPPNK